MYKMRKRRVKTHFYKTINDRILLSFYRIRAKKDLDRATRALQTPWGPKNGLSWGDWGCLVARCADKLTRMSTMKELRRVKMAYIMCHGLHRRVILLVIDPL